MIERVDRWIYENVDHREREKRFCERKNEPQEGYAVERHHYL